MNHAARSGKQNIAEGYLQKSIKSRIKLVGVARGSLEELLVDYQDFIRQKGYRFWEKTSSEAQAVRKLVYNRYNGYNNYKEFLQNPEQAANAMICLINQTNNMLDQKLRWMEERFVQEGGFRESLFRKRITYRNQNQP
jgi:four helix bundle suffix protein